MAQILDESLMGGASIPPEQWLDKFPKPTKSNRKKITVEDMLDEDVMRPESSSSRKRPNSPRSLEACLILGFDPKELMYHAPEDFAADGLSEDLQRMKYDKFESLRQDRLKKLVEVRNKLIARGDSSSSPWAKSKNIKKTDSERDLQSSEMLEREKKRLEVVQRRQQKELEQLLNYEKSRQDLKQQAEKKMAEQERRMSAQKALREKRETEWQIAMRERELQRAKEEAKLEMEAKALAAQKYREEIVAAQREQQKEKRRQYEAHLREQERIEKAEYHRKQTESILKEQQDLITRKMEEVQKRDYERQLTQDKLKKERQIQNEIKRQKAEERLQRALEANRKLLIQKRVEYEEKQVENQKRKEEREEKMREEEERKAREELARQRNREEKFLEAQKREEQRVHNIIRKQREAEERLAIVREKHNQKSEQRKMHKHLISAEKKARVESMKRAQVYKRKQMLRKIKSDTERALSLKAAKENLQEKRKLANMQATFERQMVYDVMEKIQTGKNLAALSLNGELTVESLKEAITPKARR